MSELRDTTHSAKSYELVAMAPAGDVFFVRLPAGALWLVPARPTGEPRLASPIEVEDALARQGFDLVQETFVSWPELDSRLQERAAWVTPDSIVDIQEFDEDDVRDVLDIVEEWIRAGRVSAADEALIALIQSDAIRRSDTLSGRVQELLRRTRKRGFALEFFERNMNADAFARVNGPLLAAA